MMRVEQQSNPIIELLQQAGTEGKPSAVGLGQEIAAKRSSAAGTQSVNLKDATYLKPEKEDKDTLADELGQEETLDAADRKNQMVVLAGTTSEEDYRKMQEDGFSLDSTTANTIVTVTDKIKAELAKAGVDISCFGDDLSTEQLMAITGDTGLAMQLAASMKNADLPVSEDAAKDAMEALTQAQGMSAPQEGAIKYLLDNQLSPTIGNLYTAEFSGGYQTPEAIDISSFEDQIQNVIESAGMEVNETTLADSKWLLENEIPLTAEHLQYMEALKQMQFPLDTQLVIDGITEAISEGGSARDALLIPEFRLLEQAKQAVETVSNATAEDVDYLLDSQMEVTVANLAKAAGMRGMPQTGAGYTNNTTTNIDANIDTEQAVETVTAAADAVQTPSAESTQESYAQTDLDNLTARRQLEEIRLAMTVEANYSLLKKGISIDTEPISQLIDQLKSMEEEYYVNLLNAQGAENAKEKASLLLETTEKIAGIKTVPAYVLGYRQTDVSTIEHLHQEGTALKDTFERANRSYETMMTTPNAELGDSIQKAFGNVDEILKETNLPLTDENRRAVRILAYNQTAITTESVAQVKAADEQVQRAFKNLTPAVVTHMIKEGINPLEMQIADVNETAEQIASELGDKDKEQFGEYLWKLEQNQQIREEERSAYIGIYRLIRQVENTDGAAVGALVQQGAPVTMKNLITAVRSERRSGKMDISVDDSFGELETLKSTGVSITEQIEAGYQWNCLKDVMDEMTPAMIGTVMEQNPNWQDMTPEQLKRALQQVQTDVQGGERMKEEQKLSDGYAREQLAQFAESANVSEDVYAILQKYDVPDTSMNLLALEAMLSNRNQMFQQIFGGKRDNTLKPSADDGDNETESAQDSVLEAFAEGLDSPEKLQEAQQKLQELAENQIEETMNQETVTSLDVRSMKLLSAQIKLNTSFLKEEQYSIPVRMDDEVVNVSLKIVRGTGTKGVVDVTMERGDSGKIAATFQVKEQGINGLVVSDRRETKEALENMEDGWKEQLAGTQEDTAVEIRFAQISGLDLNHFSMGAYGLDANGEDAAQETAETYPVQTARLYRVAESFIRMVQGTL